MQRPDLSNVEQTIRNYIEYLEAQLQLKFKQKTISGEGKNQIGNDYSFTEPPTTINILTFSKQGMVKRTPRHHYSRQHRGGMGIFDLEPSPKDEPAFLVCADEKNTLLLFSDLARVYRYPLSKIEEAPPRSKGQVIDRLPLEENERIVAAVIERASGYVALASRRGFVRCLRHHLFGEHLRPGTSMYNLAEFGSLASVCWTSGDDDLFITSQKGMAIRFNEKSLPPQGSKGISLTTGDGVVSVTAVRGDGQVCIISADGKGTTRLMSGFAPNKSPGGSGKIAMKSPKIVSAMSVSSQDELFLISRQSKIIRFLADEIPPSQGVVQGVNCMTLRNDEVVAVTLGTSLK
jgi:DNA gyrase subunit A